MLINTNNDIKNAVYQLRKINKANGEHELLEPDEQVDLEIISGIPTYCKVDLKN